ncbi:MAG: DUF3820 family protein [Verrucomicrobiae bacterium]|nr:DUF3820 family protein [Verrucomicrobiae bacterium]MCP5542255.1 DUF3820 family protein [Akkermansiaceae bacterium]MCP5551840.1 DUF3820 family protein [Akkermansiaceae bacterium]
MNDDPENAAADQDGGRPRFDPDAMRADLADYLDDLRRYRMPFGRYRHKAIHDLPYEYLHWFVERGEGFPTGRLGELMEFVYHVKATGAEAIFGRLRGR